MEKCNTEKGFLVLNHDDSNKKQFKNYKNSKNKTYNIKECFMEYSLEDKIEALKNMLDYNEKHIQKLPSHITNMCNIKQIIGVKECIQPVQETSFQTIISELRNTVMNSYWNKEVGKTRYQIPYLPVGMNPLEVTFGKKFKSEIPLECQYYSTEYNTTIGKIDRIDTTKIPTAGVYKDLDKPTAYSLIHPNIFTKHGLSYTDLSKLRSKEEIRSIFEAIGIQFPNNSFDLLWEKGIKKSCTDNVSVEIFANLLDQYDDIINNKIN